MDFELSTNLLLSLILCSRNDEYMGNSLWRLKTSLDYVAARINELGKEEEVEIIVADWGSEVPLSEALALKPATQTLVRFIHIPKSIADELQQDSPFPEVLALNAAARRARGRFIGRIDQDTLVGKRFLEFFFQLCAGAKTLTAPADQALMFANHRMVPFSLASASPSAATVKLFVKLFGRRLIMDHRNPRALFYSAGVGIWLLHRNLWEESGGYDERMIYMNSMEVNMVHRLMKKYQLVNLGQVVQYDFYHLEHYHPAAVRRSSSHRKVNSPALFNNPANINDNDNAWGLKKYALEFRPASQVDDNASGSVSLKLLISSGAEVIRNVLLRAMKNRLTSLRAAWGERVMGERG